MELGVGKSLECLSALFFGDEASTLKVIESKDVLELSIAVDDRSVSVHLSLFQNVDQEGIDVIWLLIRQNSS